MNFTSYKKFYFCCLASVELKSHTKVLKNLFHNMVLKNLHVTTILPSYFSIGRTYQMDGPKQMLWNIFCALVRPSTLQITASKENVFVFFQFEYTEFSGYVHFFRYRPQIPFLGKFGRKNQNCPFKLKFGT